MISKAQTAEETIQQVVRGERPLADLAPLGMKAEPEESRCQFLSSFPSETRVSLRDLAKGFLAHSQDSRGLKEWAFVMEAMPADFATEEHPEGEAVLNALWKASFGEALSESEMELFKKLGTESPSQ
jgi:hypothetical protein